MHLLSENSESFLRSLSFWDPEEIIISTQVAGEGNMNAVLRIQTNKRTVIAKQSFPFVRKFPQIPAPLERIDTEYQFLKLVELNSSIKEFSPLVLDYFPDHHLLLLEDLGKGSDFLDRYKPQLEISNSEINGLFEFLNELHGIKAEIFPENMAMRKLNHEHIFNFPFVLENGFDLDQVMPGLQDASIPFKKEKDLKLEAEKLGNRYLSKGYTLLHGDYYPGSWLKTKRGTKIIDPEFGFLGDKEFDLGVFMAHLIFSGFDSDEAFDQLKNYRHEFNEDLVEGYTGVELLRRLIGLAQLPLEMSLDDRIKLMELGRKLILNP